MRDKLYVNRAVSVTRKLSCSLRALVLSPLSDHDLRPDPTPFHLEVDTTALGDHLLFVGCCKLVNNTTLHLQDKVEGVVLQGLPTDSAVLHTIMREGCG